jgi:hypothetical protein
LLGCYNLDVSQRLKRRIPNAYVLTREATAWQDIRNAQKQLLIGALGLLMLVSNYSACTQRSLLDAVPVFTPLRSFTLQPADFMQNS